MTNCNNDCHFSYFRHITKLLLYLRDFNAKYILTTIFEQIASRMRNRIDHIPTPQSENEDKIDRKWEIRLLCA